MRTIKRAFYFILSWQLILSSTYATTKSGKNDLFNSTYHNSQLKFASKIVQKFNADKGFFLKFIDESKLSKKDLKYFKEIKNKKANYRLSLRDKKLYLLPSADNFFIDLSKPFKPELKYNGKVYKPKGNYSSIEEAVEHLQDFLKEEKSSFHIHELFINDAHAIIEFLLHAVLGLLALVVFGMLLDAATGGVLVGMIADRVLPPYKSKVWNDWVRTAREESFSEAMSEITNAAIALTNDCEGKKENKDTSFLGALMSQLSTKSESGVDKDMEKAFLSYRKLLQDEDVLLDEEIICSFYRKKHLDGLIDDAKGRSKKGIYYDELWDDFKIVEFESAQEQIEKLCAETFKWLTCAEKNDKYDITVDSSSRNNRGKRYQKPALPQPIPDDINK